LSIRICYVVFILVTDFPVFYFFLFGRQVWIRYPGTKDHKNTVFVVRYGEEDLAGAKSLVDQCPADDPDTEMNLACLLAKEGRLQVPW
jgi:hypothetical protein